MRRDYNFDLEEFSHRVHQSLDEGGAADHDHGLLDIHFLELLLEDLLGNAVAGRCRHVLTGAAGSEGVDEALGTEHDTVTVHGHPATHAFHRKRPEFRDIDPETLCGHLQEPAACTGTNAAHRKGARDTVHDRDRLVVHPPDIDHGGRPVLLAGKVNRPFGVNGQLFLDQIGVEIFSDQKTPVAGGADRLDILKFHSRFGKSVVDYLPCALKHLCRRLPSGADDLVGLHQDGLGCRRAGVDPERDPFLDLPGQKRPSPGNGRERFHAGEERPCSRALGKRVTDDRELRMFENIAPEFVSYDRGLGTPETGRNKNCVGLHPAVDQRHRSRYGEFQVGTPDLKAEPVKIPHDILERDVRVEDLAVHGFCGCVNFLLNARVVRAAGELGDAYRSGHGFPPRSVRNRLIAATNCVPSSSFFGYSSSSFGMSFCRIKNFRSSFVRAQPMQPNARSALLMMIAASHFSTIGPYRDMRPRTPLGTSTAAQRSPFLGSSGVIWSGMDSSPAVWTRSRMAIAAPRGVCPNRVTISERIRLVAG